MNLPASFARDGFTAPTKSKLKKLLIGTDGWADTGKTEFGLSAPGPTIALVLDRGFESILDNPNPPKTRREDFAVKIIPVQMAETAPRQIYVDCWAAYRNEYKKALANPDARTIIIDGDSDSWEMQRLAAFGKLTQIPPLMYVECNAYRRAMIAMAWDSGKIVIFTNKLKDKYKTEKVDGKDKQVKTGEEERQGFPDQNYLYQLQLRHLYDSNQHKYGVRITKCKADTSLVGLELWGDDCNFQSVVQTIYPHIPLTEWGYK